jgi:hypothetical protein
MQIQDIFSVQTLFLALAIGVLTQMIKNAAEARWSNLSPNKNWGKVWVPTISVFLGMALSVGTSIIPGFLAAGTLQDKILFGIIAGWASSYVFRIANGFLKKEVPDDGSVSPDAIPGPPKMPTFPQQSDKK